MKQTGTFNIAYSADRPIGVKPLSVLEGTALYDHARNIDRGDAAVDNFFDIFEEAACAFEKECAEAFGITRSDAAIVNKRYEYIRTFIIKVLLFLDVFKRTKHYAAIAYMIEKLAVHPETDIALLMDEVANKIGASRSAITHAVENCFDIYDGWVAERIEYLTDSKPVTAKDAMFDVALFVRTRFYGGAHYE
ncbi:MAG: hypothetical protein NC184_00935 [Roseburia sp.]|nr:hypothetical protein [Roseburia sp.]